MTSYILLSFLFFNSKEIFSFFKNTENDKFKLSTGDIVILNGCPIKIQFVSY